MSSSSDFEAPPRAALAFRDAAEHLDAHFRALLWDLRAWVALRRFAFHSPLDPLRVLEHVISFIPPRLALPNSATLESAVTSATLARAMALKEREHLARRLEASYPGVAASTLRLPLEELRASAGLGDGAVALLTWLVLYGGSPLFGQAVAAVLPKGVTPTLGTVVEMLDLPPDEGTAAMRAVSTEAPLVRFGWVRWAKGAGESHALELPEVPDPARELLLGQPPTTADEGPGSTGMLYGFSEASEATVRTALGAPRVAGRAWAVLLRGGRGAGRRTWLRARVAQNGGTLHVVPQHALHVGELPAALREAIRGEMVRSGAVLLRADHARGAWTDEVRREVASLLRAYGRPVFVGLGPSEAWPLAGWLEGEHVVEVRELSSEERSAVWSTALDVRGLRSPLGPSELAARLRATPGAICRTLDRWLASERARQRRGGGLTLDPEAIAAELDVTTTEHVRGVAELLSTPLGWDDLVAPAELTAVLRDILDHARLAGEVFEAWGFGQKVPYGRGLAVLFHGPPGTGKTMAATLVAKSLGRPLYRIDLSRVVDKYVGETEKNLARVFDVARTTNGVILFDEADSLFTKRTQVSSANDRYANLEVNFLLQQVESFEGLAILTTNNAEVLDPAFKRRMRFRVLFPEPTAEDRARMWRGFIPTTAPTAPNIAFAQLGRDYDISGGHIKQAALRAAFRAAAQGRPISFGDLEEAAVQECRELGKLVGRRSAT